MLGGNAAARGVLLRNAERFGVSFHQLLAITHAEVTIRVQGSDFRVQGSGFRVQGSGSRVQGSGFRVQGSGLLRNAERFGVAFHQLAITHAEVRGVVDTLGSVLGTLVASDSVLNTLGTGSLPSPTPWSPSSSSSLISLQVLGGP